MSEASAAMLDGLFAAAPVGLALLDRDLRFLRVNAALAAINGVSVEATIGRSLREVVPDLADTIEPLLRRVVERGETFAEATVRGETAAAPGRPRRWSASYFPVRDAVGTIVAAGVAVTEETERHAEQQALRESEEHFRALVQRSSDVVVVLDTQGTMRYVSPSARRIFGYDAEQVVGQNAFAFIHPDDVPRLMQSFGGVVQRPGVYQPIEFRMRNPDGSWRYVEASATNMLDDPNVGGIVQNLRDISDRKAAEQERERLLAREQAARAEAEAANRARDAFLSTVSHELRTPLTPILAYSQLLSRGRLGPEQARQALAQIERSAQMQARLVEDILDASRIIAGKLSLASERVDLCTVVEAAVAIVRPSAENRSINLHVSLDGCPIDVLGDATRLQQVVWNLLANAIKFTPLRGNVDLALVRDAGEAVLTVRDTGQGIEAEFLPHVFERYRQAEPNAPRQTGLGLGLALVRQLVQMHHGSVTAASAGRDQGATFTVRLPLLAGANAEQTDSAATEGDGANGGRLAGLTILVVEDDRPTRELLALVLGAQGATAVTVDSAEAALEALERVRPALLLADIGLPGMDGYELLAAARRLPAGEALPAVALTAYAGDEDRDRALAAGFAAHLAKPLDPDALVNALAALATPSS
ncbi:MAG TPA: PAS domain-containing protein [Dehalococcoidia bacterium]|nr:PAS domain-containing protein [Dehalococcoidia bacterium]